MFQWAPIAFQKFSEDIDISGRWYWIRSSEISRRDAISSIEFLHSWWGAILKGEARRRSANPNERVDRIPLLEGEGFSNLTKRGSSTVCVNEDSLRASISMSVRWGRLWPISIVGTLLVLISSPFIPYDSFVNLLLRAFAKPRNTARRVLSKLHAPRTFQDLPAGPQAGHTETLTRSSLSDRGKWEEITLSRCMYVC